MDAVNALCDVCEDVNADVCVDVGVDGDVYAVQHTLESRAMRNADRRPWTRFPSPSSVAWNTR